MMAAWCVVSCGVFRGVAAPREDGTARAKTRAQAPILRRSAEVLRALERDDTIALARYVHPTRGLRFSPYVFAHKSDVVFTRPRLRGLKRDKKRYLWGSYDGSGTAIRLTWREYRKAFVWDGAFSRVRPRLNQFERRGNTNNNLRAFYTGASFTEYYRPASKDRSDWKSLWLIWRREGATWFLCGIAHDEWTI